MISICLYGKHLSQSSNPRGFHIVDCLPRGKASVPGPYPLWRTFLNDEWIHSALQFCSWDVHGSTSFPLSLSVFSSVLCCSVLFSPCTRLQETNAYCIAMVFLANRHPRVLSDRSPADSHPWDLGALAEWPLFNGVMGILSCAVAAWWTVPS